MRDCDSCFMRMEDGVTQFDKMLRLLDKAWLLRSEIVPCLVGPPGIGKTAAVMQHAKAHDCGKVVKIVASRCIPSETVGMTMPDHKNRSMDIYNSMQLSSLEDGDILFLDELLEADQFVLSTLLTVIESREMADGTPLPDIQIIAATNDTIPPEQLKGNIRQRFMFQRFEMDRTQTGDYIAQQTGLRLPSSVLDALRDSGGDYNFLTPRSLTKLCIWMNQARNINEASDIASVINDMWKSTIGSLIFDVWHAKETKTPEEQVKDAVKDILGNDADGLDFENCTMPELYDILQGLPDWEKISKTLATLTINEPDNVDADITF